MGFLDHSTNNVILDAVLTDKGRELLANGVGNFSIAKFAYADDEVNYNIIEQFGRTVGKEKIEKNTPVLEASTTGYLGIKYRNLSLNNNSLSVLPTLKLNTTLASSTTSLYRGAVGGKSSASITLSQHAPSGVVIDVDNTDYSFRVTVDNLFLAIQGYVPDTVDNYNIATYTIPANAAINSANLSKVTFNLMAKNVSQDVFDTFSHVSDNSSIVSRVITVSGYNSGQFASFNANVF